MKKLGTLLLMAAAVMAANQALAAADGFQKVSDHCYSMQLKNGENVSAVVTEEGILIVDPPEEPELASMIDALKRFSPKSVRWVVLTNPRSARSAGTLHYAQQGALLIAGAQLRKYSASLPGADTSAYSWIIFESQVRLFPSDVEIRILALDQKALTGGDVVLHVPSEKVLIVGKLYEAARYPEIDASAFGNAGTWADGLKMVVDSVPVLKPAIPPKSPLAARRSVPAKPAPPGQPSINSKQPEVTLEEGISVISTLGEVSNLQNMKDLLSACQKLRADISRAVKSGRSCEGFLESSRADIYRVYGNLDSYASQLCVGFTPLPEK